MKRGLSDKFMGDLQDGILKSLLSRVRKDTSLDLQIRADGINIYYRGGSLLRVDPIKKSPGAYRFFFNDDYGKRGKIGSKAKVTISLPHQIVADKSGCEDWIRAVPLLKDTMDLWFGENPKDERALQQLVVWENNDSPWANGTDYFIIDIEYDNRKGNSAKGEGGRFDLVALYWASDRQARQLKGKLTPRLAVIEMKAGDGALKGKAGLQAHIDVLEKFNASGSGRKAFAEEMMTAFRQKQQLGLVRALPLDRAPATPRRLPSVTDLAPEIEYMLLLVGHDPASTKLRTELAALKTKLPLAVCAANFMGFGLYKENVHPLPDFLATYGRRI